MVLHVVPIPKVQHQEGKGKAGDKKLLDALEIKVGSNVKKGQVGSGRPPPLPLQVAAGSTVAGQGELKEC